MNKSAPRFIIHTVFTTITTVKMKYRTIERPGEVSLRSERRSVMQLNNFPLEDLNGNIIYQDRRKNTATQVGGLEVTETNISQAEFQEYFDKRRDD
jgi:hypothetical protein